MRELGDTGFRAYKPTGFRCLCSCFSALSFSPHATTCFCSVLAIPAAASSPLSACFQISSFTWTVQYPSILVPPLPPHLLSASWSLTIIYADVDFWLLSVTRCHSHRDHRVTSWVPFRPITLASMSTATKAPRCHQPTRNNNREQSDQIVSVEKALGGPIDGALTFHVHTDEAASQRATNA